MKYSSEWVSNKKQRVPLSSSRRVKPELYKQFKTIEMQGKHHTHKYGYLQSFVPMMKSLVCLFEVDEASTNVLVASHLHGAIALLVRNLRELPELLTSGIVILLKTCTRCQATSPAPG